jgi:hypothetical protein
MYNLIFFTNHVNRHTQLFTTNKSSSSLFTSEYFCAVNFSPFSAFLVSNYLPNFSHTIPPINLTVMNVIKIEFIFPFKTENNKRKILDLMKLERHPFGRPGLGTFYLYEII